MSLIIPPNKVREARLQKLISRLENRRLRLIDDYLDVSEKMLDQFDENGEICPNAPEFKTQQEIGQRIKGCEGSLEHAKAMLKIAEVETAEDFVKQVVEDTLS